MSFARDHQQPVRASFNNMAYGTDMPNHHRDASNTRMDAQQWKGKKPTPLGHCRPSGGPYNPYNASRMTSNLHGPKVGNRTADRTVFDISSGSLPNETTLRPTKRQRTDTDGVLSVPTASSRYFSGPGFSGSHLDTRSSIGASGRTAPRHSEPHPEAIVIDDEDEDKEDIGIPVNGSHNRHTELQRKSSSPDPLNCLGSSAAGPSSMRLDDIHDFDKPANQRRTRNHGASDGPATQRLQARLTNIHPEKPRPVIVIADEQENRGDGETHDPIESFEEDTDRGGRLKVPAGIVRENVKRFEQHQQSTPTLDLTKQTTVKSRMKTRIGAPQLERQPLKQARLDPVATAPSGFDAAPKKRNTRKLQPEPSSVIALKLEAYSLCYNLVESRPEDTYWLTFDPSTCKLAVRQSPHADALVEFNGNIDFHAMAYSKTPPSRDHPTILKLELSKQCRSIPELNLAKPGSGGHGIVAFKFEKEHPNLTNSDALPAIVEKLIPNVNAKEILDGHASKTCWDFVTNPANHKVAELERKRRSNLTKKEIGNKSSASSDTQASDTFKPRPQPRSVVKAAPNGDVVEESRPSRITRQSARIIARSSPSAEPDELILVYPPTGAGAIHIRNSDLKRLEERQYFNDTVIEFGLKLWLNELRASNPQLAEDVHVFSSFFYKMINVKKKDEGYQSVRKWTSKFDIFRKKYVIVPINENFHWYLAIIYNPEYILHPPPPPSPPRSVTRKRKRELSEVKATETAEASHVGTEPASRPTTPSTNALSVNDSEADEEAVGLLLGKASISDTVDLPQDMPDDTARVESGQESIYILGDLQYPESDDDRMDIDNTSPPSQELEIIPAGEIGADGDIEVTSVKSSASIGEADVELSHIPPSRFYGSAPTSSKGKEKARDKEKASEPIDIPEEQPEPPDEESENTGDAQQTTYVFILDSLNQRHSSVANTLSTYLQYEAKDKKGLENTSRAKGKAARVPGQQNWYDCGPYVLHFAETFMTDPDRFVDIILNKHVKNYSFADRQMDWNAEAVENFRAKLKARIETLSASWKEDKAAKEQQTRESALENQTGITTPAASVVPDSDDEIEVGDVIPKLPVSKGKSAGRTRGKGGAVKNTAQTGPAARLR